MDICENLVMKKLVIQSSKHKHFYWEQSKTIQP